MMRRKWPNRKSEPQSDISTILTMNSRAGCDIAELPRPRPYHLPVHQARLVSSCLNSRVRKTAIRNFWIVRWMAMMAITPSTACDASQSSRNQKNSKNAIRPTRLDICAKDAMTDPNFAHDSIIGPKKRETKNRVIRTAAFHTTGPTATTPMRIRGLGCWLPFLSGNDFTNMYAMTKIAEMQMGEMISEKITVRHVARGTSPESFSEGWPSFFFLYPVIIVLDNRQYPYQLLAFVLELPRDIQRKNSR